MLHNAWRTATVEVNVAESAVKAVTPTPVSLGAEDCSTAWWTEFTKDMKIPAGETFEFNFTNYSSGAGNWNNYVLILRKADLAEYAVVRADNYGWGNGYAACTPIGTQGDWATWLRELSERCWMRSICFLRSTLSSSLQASASARISR